MKARRTSASTGRSAPPKEFFRSLGLATRLHELQIGQDTIDEIVRRFNERGSRLGEAGNITGDVTRRILELCK